MILLILSLKISKSNFLVITSYSIHYTKLYDNSNSIFKIGNVITKDVNKINTIEVTNLNKINQNSIENLSKIGNMNINQGLLVNPTQWNPSDKGTGIVVETPYQVYMPQRDCIRTYPIPTEHYAGFGIPT